MSCVLAIDDDAAVRALMTEMLARAGYETIAAASASDGLRILAEQRVDAIVSDILMPDCSGLELVERVQVSHPNLPVVLVTSASTTGLLADALGRGAQGFVAKPFTVDDLGDAVARAIQRADRTEQDLRDRLLAPTLATALANAVEARQADMNGHCQRLSALACRIAAAYGLDAAELDQLAIGATLHDVGKIGIPDRILLHPGELDAADEVVMRTHTLIGDRLLAPFELLAEMRPIVRHHHERWDGTGYPDGLRGEEIPLTARVVALADAIEAMSSSRVYRQALPSDAILAELRAGRGRQWDPHLVDVVEALVEHGELEFGADGLELLDVLAPRRALERARVAG